MPRKAKLFLTTFGLSFLAMLSISSVEVISSNSPRNAPLKGMPLVASRILSNERYFKRIALIKELRVMLRRFASSFS